MASGLGIGGRSGRVRRGQQISGGGAVAESGRAGRQGGRAAGRQGGSGVVVGSAAAAGQESTPTARPRPLYR